jgi:hypothetical protein
MPQWTLYNGSTPIAQVWSNDDNPPDARAWVNTTANPVTLPTPVPQTVPLWQAKAVLATMPKVNAGPTLLDDATAIANASGGAVLIFWEYAPSVNRSDALMESLASQLSLTSANLDALFIAAANVVL